MTRRKSPAPPQRRALPNLPNSLSLPLNPAEDGHQAVDAADRRESELLAELAELGYAVSVRCMACGHHLVHPVSVGRHIGPRCAAKAVDQ